jgi:hypothetical protein
MISGEEIQRICDVYVGYNEDLYGNPVIAVEAHKHLALHNIQSEYDNPVFIFCYPHRIHEFYQKIEMFINPFVLVTHNSDYTVTDKDIYIAEHPKIRHWYAQNTNIIHSKITNLPIGIANSQWDHGNKENWNDIVLKPNCEKENIYFYFNVATNRTKRLECQRIIESKGLKFGEHCEHASFLRDLALNYRYAVCPEGNGIDSHRVWECLYTNTIPICIRSSNTSIIEQEYPIVLLDSWDDLDINNIPSPNISFSDGVTSKLQIEYYINKIFGCSKSVGAGRLGNRIFIHSCMSMLAEKHDLKIEYDKYIDPISKLGIDFYVGTKIFKDTMIITDDNFYNVLQDTNIKQNIKNDDNVFFQTRSSSNVLYNYIQSKKNNIKNKNPFTSRYKSNNDCFVHIRLDDAAIFNPGSDYYIDTLSKISFDTLYLSSDSSSHPIIDSILNIYSNAKFITYNEIETIQFGSTCKYVILSHGSYSAIIGYMAFHSDIYYPSYDGIVPWFGDMFSNDGWMCSDVKRGIV